MNLKNIVVIFILIMVFVCFFFSLSILLEVKDLLVKYFLLYSKFVGYLFLVEKLKMEKVLKFKVNDYLNDCIGNVLNIFFNDEVIKIKFIGMIYDYILFIVENS